GNLTGAPQLGDPRFEEVGSGWYWQAVLIDKPNAQSLQSASLNGGDLPALPIDDVPFGGSNFERDYLIGDASGVLVRVVETEFLVTADDIVVRVRAAANYDEFLAAIETLRRSLIGILSLFAIGLLVLNAALINFGLRPLAAARDELADIQSGKAAELAGPYPREIAPLAAEINLLIENNRRVVDRARTQVGNLAHALKTPLAVLRNEAGAEAKVEAALVREQTEEMNTYVQSYLKRAQIAAQSGGAVFRTDAVETVTRLVSVMRKLNPDKEIALYISDDNLTFAGERSDLEEILGNLLENATKWSKSKVVVALSHNDAANDQLVLCVEDDGPGIPKENRTQALMRGKRLDEAVPGTGLGLSIVVDTVDAYRGALLLDRSTLGGLLVRATLPTSR
ncbi:MAG: ATP-binding protein, partial [Pseudomonadota bacterium]